MQAGPRRDHCIIEYYAFWNQMDCQATCGVRNLLFHVSESYRKAQSHFSNMDSRDKYLMIGGFIFLRFITPGTEVVIIVYDSAIISPDLYGLTDEKLTYNHRRTLLLVYKLSESFHTIRLEKFFKI
jgi:hypothetical protein